MKSKKSIISILLLISLTLPMLFGFAPDEVATATEEIDEVAQIVPIEVVAEVEEVEPASQAVPTEALVEIEEIAAVEQIEPIQLQVPATVEQFVMNLYTVVLGRDPGDVPASAVNYWANALRTGRGSAVVTHAFFFSPEATNRNLSNEEFVRILYMGMFGRSVEFGSREVNYWSGRIRGSTRHAVFVEFANSSEFGRLSNSLGVARGTTPAAPPQAQAPAQPTVTTGTVEQFVMRLYTVVLGRDADAVPQSAVNYWANALRARRGGAVVAQAFYFSAETVNRNLSNEEFVKILYLGLFGRSVEPGSREVNYWSGRIRGSTRHAVFLEFVRSAEFNQVCVAHGFVRGNIPTTPPPAPPPPPVIQTGTVEQFVMRMYVEVLGRSPEQVPATARNYWANAIHNGRTGSVVAHAFFFSAEMNNRRLSNEEFVKALYAGMLGRPVVTGSREVNYWAGRLNRGASRHAVFVEFALSAEFNRVCQAHGIERGTPPPAQQQVPPQPMVPTGTAEQFVMRMYTVVLGRSPWEVAPSDINYWANALHRGRGGAMVAHSFFFSAEMLRRNLSNEEFVQVLYLGLFGRPVEIGFREVNYWGGRLNRGESRHSVFTQFANSAEFYRFCAAHGFARGTLTAHFPGGGNAQQQRQDQEIWNFLLGLGLSQHAVAGIMGNLYSEGTFNPAVTERARHYRIDSALERLFAANGVQRNPPGATAATRNAAMDRDYVTAINRGWYTLNDFQDGVGFGIAQWTWWSRKRDLHNFVGSTLCSRTLSCCRASVYCNPNGVSRGFNIACLERQLVFLAFEMQGYAGGTFWRNLRNATTVRAASDIVLTEFLKPANAHLHSARRAAYAEGFFALFAR